MNAGPRLYVHSYAACGTGTELLPPHRIVAGGAVGARRARLPGIAVEMTHRLLGTRAPHPRLHVMIGTSLGDATETEQFVRNLVVAEEATPKPRAFSQSVHCAIAGQIAIEFGARGEAQTITHGEVSFGLTVLAAQALKRRSPDATMIVGALDEGGALFTRIGYPDLVAAMPENGALLLCAGPNEAIAALEFFAGGQNLDGTVTGAHLRAACAEAILWVPPFGVPSTAPPGSIVLAANGPHSLAAAATTTALAIAIVAGEVPAACLGLATRPALLAVLAASRFGDWNAVLVRNRP